MFKSLENTALEWAKSVIDEPVLTYISLDRSNRNSKIFKLYTSSQRFVLILRLNRNPNNRNQLQPRSMSEVENEVETIRICKDVGPELIDYQPEIGAILFESIPEKAKSLTDLLYTHDNNNISNLINKPLETLSEIHTKPMPIQYLYSNYKEELYSYILHDARKICSDISMPTLSSISVLLHGNPNPGNWWQISKNVGIWLDFEDTHIGYAEFDFGYLMGHLRILKGNAIIENVFDILEKLNIEFNKDGILQISTIVIYYIISTENRFQRYPFIDFIHVLEEIV